jgi:ABC-type branched-subunit amino acid transport system substrate-binding protein
LKFLKELEASGAGTSNRRHQGETTMKKKFTRRAFGATALGGIAATTFPAPYLSAAEKKYGPGANDTEIKLGQTVPHSGPGSLYGVLGRVGEAYFQMLNETKGGINGRKMTFLTLDDAYSAPKCVEATRRLVEQEEVLALFGSLGTAPQTAVHKYLNSKGVPQLLLNTGASKWNDPKNNKWTMAGLPLYPTERRFRPRLPWSVQEDAGGCRRQGPGDHGADLRSHRSHGRLAVDQSLQVGRRHVL